MKTYQNQAEWSKAHEATPDILDILEGYRKQVREGSMGYGDIIDLADHADYIPLGDTELLEAAGVPEFNLGYCDCEDNTSLIVGETCEECGQIVQEATK